MAARDVDNVDPASPPQVPERIELAERWRVAGKKLRTRSPAVFAKVFEMLVTCEVGEEAPDTTRMTNCYLKP